MLWVCPHLDHSEVTKTPGEAIITAVDVSPNMFSRNVTSAERAPNNSFR